MYTDIEVLERFPLTLINNDNKDFYRGLLEKQLLMDKCQDCGNWCTCEHSICPECWSKNLTPTPVSGEGTVFLLIYLHQGPEVSGVDYGNGGYPVAAIELNEQKGLRFVSTIVGYDKTQLSVGTKVQLEWIDRDGCPFPVFRPVAN